MSKMKEPRIEKVTLNIGIGESGDKLEKAMKLLGVITNRKPIQTKTMERIPKILPQRNHNKHTSWRTQNHPNWQQRSVVP